MCGSLPNVLFLHEVNIAKLNGMRKARTESLEMISHRKDKSFPDMTVPELRSDSF